MKHTLKIILVSFGALILFACSSSSSPGPTTPPGGSTTTTGIIANGEVYYMSECAVCHKAGTGDPSQAFASSDLADNYKIAKANGGSNIVADMHAIGPAKNLMGRFDKISAQNIADMEAYLLSVAP